MRAYTSDWEQECCGASIPVDSTAELLIEPLTRSSTAVADLADWYVTGHDAGEPDPPRRVRAQLLRVQGVRFRQRQAPDGSVQLIPGSATYMDLAWLPGASDLAAAAGDAGDDDDREASALGTVVLEASYSPPPGWEPGPDGWLLDIEVVEDLGPMHWEG